jgi:hypothetical protein
MVLPMGDLSYRDTAEWRDKLSTDPRAREPMTTDPATTQVAPATAKMRFTLVLPTNLYAQLSHHARDRGDTMQSVIRAALRAYLKKER